MQKTSLKEWVIILTIIPTTLIGFSLASYFAYSRSAELNNFLELRAKNIIEPIAIASRTALLNKDKTQLRELINFTHRNHSSIIKSIAIFTQDNQTLVTSAYHGNTHLLRLNAGRALTNHTTNTHLDDYIIFRTPIINEVHFPTINDYSNTNDKSTQLDENAVVGYISMQINKNQLNFEQQSQYIIAFSLALFGSLLSALFALKLIKRVTKPVSAMVQAVERIKDGKLQTRVSGELIGELNFLKSGINAMAQSLDSYKHEMNANVDQATIDLRESLEQFEIQNVELSIAKRKAQDANRVKSEFLANMSHELRTPLNGVIGFTRQVLKTPLTESQRDYLQTIDRSANSLLTIINDILDFSKLDADKMVLENLPFSLKESLEETLTLLAPDAHKKNIELSIDIPQTLPDSLVGDNMRIKQIITNLIGNAIKFTPEGFISIDVDAEEVSDKKVKYKITVTDTGIGMTSKQQRTIFDAFTQADQTITRLYGGTGLGLVICQRLAQEMRGDIGFTSEENKGSSFWFTFQCDINSMPLLLELDHQYLANKTVLYYEESKHSREATKNIFKHWNMRVTSVINQHQLAEVITHTEKVKRGFDYALIGHNQVETALSALKKTITQIKPIAQNILIALNNNSPNLQDALIASGADSCMSKPLTSNSLQKMLQPLINQQGEQLTLSAPVNKILPIKVLAVDDNEANLKLIKALLLEQVEEVVTAQNGERAITLCKEESFSLIFMDIQMPVMDGISALKEIKELNKNNDTPIIAVTAHALSGEREKMHQQGFDAYMTKPIDESMLRHIIYEYCDFKDLANIEVDRSSKVTNNSDDEAEQIFASEEAVLIKEPRFTEEEITQTLINEDQQEAIQLDIAPNNTLSSAFHLEDIAPIEKVIDWQLALERSANKADLAKEMFLGLIGILPETEEKVRDAIKADDTAAIKQLIHKLNGACCYTGTPSLAKVVIELETQLKMGLSVEELEPEFLEFFEQVEQVLTSAQDALKEVS